LVSLVRDFRDPEQDGCGLAWLLGGGLQGIGAGEGWDELGYSVIGDGYDEGSDGKSYFCQDESLAHELGHNMGAAHDKETAQGDDGNLDNPDDYGAFTYSFGYKDAAAGFYTVMAYGEQGQSIYRVFSNPAINYCGGFACGADNQADNARSLRQTIPTVAGFRVGVVPVMEGSSPKVDARANDANADGRSDLFWHSSVYGGMQPWLMNGAHWQYGVLARVAGIYGVVGVGDFNGDKRADLLWSEEAEKDNLWVWLAQSNGTYAIRYLRPYPKGWNVAGISDANNDGRSDVFWHNPEKGYVQPWLMSGASWTYGRTEAAPAGSIAAGIGDFSGDGVADILWHDTFGSGLYVWLRTVQGGHVQHYLRPYPTGWKVAGILDVNGDKRADILWHSPSRQSAQPWLMNGAAWTYGLARSVASKYEVGATGDFNGDGLGDVFWRDSAQTEAWVWLGLAGNGFTVSYLRRYPAGWSTIQ
jgi:hypothetical protein